MQLLYTLPIAQTVGKFVEKYLTQVRSIQDFSPPALSLEASPVWEKIVLGTSKSHSLISDLWGGQYIIHLEFWSFSTLVHSSDVEIVELNTA